MSAKSFRPEPPQGGGQHRNLRYAAIQQDLSGDVEIVRSGASEQDYRDTCVRDGPRHAFQGTDVGKRRPCLLHRNPVNVQQVVVARPLGQMGLQCIHRRRSQTVEGHFDFEGLHGRQGLT